MDKYKITIDPEYSNGEDLGIDQIAFTKTPAIIVKGMAFNSNVKPLYFTDEIKMRIAAPALIPMNIYRFDEYGEYYVEFTKEEIEKMFVKFMQNLNNSSKFNLEHNKDKNVPAFVLEAWLVGKNTKADRSFSEFGVDVPEGTMFIVAQVTDKQYYNSLVENEQIGFSIEGFLGLKLSELEQKMNLNMDKLMLPDGEWVIDNKTYVVKDGEILEIKDLVEVTEDEEIIEEVKMAEEVIVEEVPVVEEESPMTIDETKVLQILQPKLDEIYQMIADLKVELEGKVNIIEEKKIEDVQMSAHERFSSVMTEYSKKRK